ncbi:MAG: hypothetical protein SGI73_00175, partial [Chloroflexota bacterium]|nr:hypothetical protein [Chloroflexota bacterium]
MRRCPGANDIDGSVVISADDETTGVAVKRSLSQFQLLQVSTVRTFTRRAFKLPDLDNRFPALERDPLQNRHELIERQIADLAPPQPLHPVDVQRLEAQSIVLVAQLMRQLEVRIAALVGNPDVRPTDELGGSLPVVRSMRFLVFARLNRSQSTQGA